MRIPKSSHLACPSVLLAVALLAAFAALLLVSNVALAVPAYPGIIEAAQPDGSTFQMRLKGDEFFHWNETEEGYAIVKDSADGFWKYAQPAKGEAAFEIVPNAIVGRSAPESLGLAKHALPDRTILRRAIEKAGRRGEAPTALPPPEAPDAAPAPASPLLDTGPSKIPVSGTTTVKNIVILASFSDHWNGGAGTVSSTYGRTTTSEYMNLFNEVNHTSDGAVGSVRDYYDEVSYGNLTINSIVTVWVVLPSNEAAYGANTGLPGTDTNPRQMVLDAIAAADTAGFDFSQGDSDGDGWVDCLTIIHSGFGEEAGAGTNSIWSHKWDLYTSVVTYDGVHMSRYHTEPALRGNSGTSISRIGVICHEMGHSFGLPDLYDYSSATDGIGDWGIMASGSWNGSSGNSPAHFCAWSKCLLGFVRPELTHSKSSISIARAEDNPVVHMFRDGVGTSGEYFLVENRAKTGFDNSSQVFPGLVIYHVDSNSADNDLGTWLHPVVKIEEGDGNNSEGVYGLPQSETGDVWTSTNGIAGGFRDATGDQDCNAMLYQTHFYNRPLSTTPTYNQLSSFSAAATTMTYTASTLIPTVDSQTVTTNTYTVNWGACTNAIQYEIDEGTTATATTFTDGAENEEFMYENWYLNGTVQRSNGGARTGSYSYLMQFYDGAGKWYPDVQALTMKTPFKITGATAINFYYIDRTWTTPYQHASLRCQISNDNGTTWHTLATPSGAWTGWTLVSIANATITGAGMSIGDMCILRLVANFERKTTGFGMGYPDYGFAIDDIQIANTEIASYGMFTALSSAVAGTSFPVGAKPNGVYAYIVRAYANGTWQNFSPVATTTVDLSYTVNFVTDGTPGATLTGSTTQVVPQTGSTTPVTANDPTGYHFDKWTKNSVDYSTSNPLTVVNVMENMTLVANYLANPATTHTLSVSATNGSVTKNPDLAYYTYGTTVTLTANANAHYHFTNWTGDYPSGQQTANPIVVTMNGDKSLTAVFAIDTHTLTANATNGSVTKNPDLSSYDYGSTVSLTAYPSSGYDFSSWSGDVPSGHETDNPVEITMDGNKTVTAGFVVGTPTPTPPPPTKVEDWTLHE
ncbi:M6 family metalloprotease domain-containing protein [Candidatus Sumerlaeota bacterium]|nr:M6 family metalloprotease domain-containing protein [Candidatus Sumerlaeota bacterium]